MSYLVILTLASLSAREASQVTFTEIIQVNAGATRGDIYELMRRQAVAQYGETWRNATVLFFSAEKNSLS